MARYQLQNNKLNPRYLIIMKEIYQANISSIYDEIHCIHLSSIYHILVLFLSLYYQQKGEQFNNVSMVKIHVTFQIVKKIHTNHISSIHDMVSFKISHIKSYKY